MKKVWVLWLVVFVCLLGPATALASVGVGVGTGRIAVKEPLRSGGIYRLPAITVFNTGTQRATYSMSVTLNQTQPQIKPDPAWISFSPRSFSLDPGKSEVVTPTAHLPLATKPGKYFAYLEAHPDRTVKQGTTTVGVAAATKLSFTVAASNVLIAIFYRLLALYQLYEPWTQIATVLLVAGIVALVLRRHLHFSIRVSRIK